MNILVCISIIPNIISKIHFTKDQKSLDTSNLQWIINPIDEYMLSKALLFQKTHGAKVSALTIGTIETENPLRKALAMGADEGIRVNYSPQDSLSTALEISKIIQEQNFDLILLGSESIDYNGSAVPSLLAQTLNIPLVNHCISLEINDNLATFIQETNQNKETLTAKLPLVISGQKEIISEKDLVIPNMRGMMISRSKHLIIKEASSHKSFPISFNKTPEREKVKYINPDNLDELIQILHKEKKLI